MRLSLYRSTITATHQGRAGLGIITNRPET